MNIKDANDSFIKLLIHQNEILRMEAQIALVRLSDNDPFGFLFQLIEAILPLGTDNSS